MSSQIIPILTVIELLRDTLAVPHVSKVGLGHVDDHVEGADVKGKHDRAQHGSLRTRKHSECVCSQDVLHRPYVYIPR